MDTTPRAVRLTELVSCGGCAAKYSAALLDELVGALPLSVDPDLLVGLAPADDAAVYRVSDEQAIVFTLDFFPPIVDDPADYGAIAATNALNDVFAMGGKPLLALSIAAFPESLPGEVLSQVFAAAASKVAEAGGVLAGGHTLRDEEPIYGLAVVGTVRPDAIWTKANARPGDVLYLTKPLGTGLLVHGRKEGLVGPDALTAATDGMKTLNGPVADVLRPLAPNAVTDVTGFGLAGHAYEMARRSEVSITLDADALPALDGALELAADGIRTGGDRRNRDYVGEALDVEPGVSDARVALAFDPQTAGGLLVALPSEAAEIFGRSMRNAGLFATRVGEVVPGAGRLMLA